MEAYRRTTTRWYTNSRIYSIVRQHRNEMCDKMERLLCTLAVNPRLYKRMIKFRLRFTSKGVLCEESSSIDAPDFYHSVNTPFASHINIVIVFRHISPPSRAWNFPGIRFLEKFPEQHRATDNVRKCHKALSIELDIPDASEDSSDSLWIPMPWEFTKHFGRSTVERWKGRKNPSLMEFSFFRVSCLGIIIHHWIHLGVFSCDAIMREVFISVSSGLPKYY